MKLGSNRGKIAALAAAVKEYKVRVKILKKNVEEDKLN